MNTLAVTFVLLSCLIAFDAHAQSSTPCEERDPAPLLAEGDLGELDDTIGKGVWMDVEKWGPGDGCDGYSSPDQVCTLNDPGLVRVNVQSHDHFYAPPAGVIVKLNVKHDGSVTCTFGGLAPKPRKLDSKWHSQSRVLGYGLVVGLDRTGDMADTSATLVALRRQYATLGMGLYDKSVFQGRIAAVLVTGEVTLPTVKGKPINVKITTAGDATSLRGGALLMTSLYGPDARVYAVGQGVLQACPGDDKPTDACITGGAVTAQ